MTFEGLHFWRTLVSPQWFTSNVLALFFTPVSKLKRVKSNSFKREHYLAAYLRVSNIYSKKQESFKTHLCSYINLNLFFQALGNAFQLSYFHKQTRNCRYCDFSFSELSQASADSPIHLYHQSFFFLCLFPKGTNGEKKKRYLLR